MKATFRMRLASESFAARETRGESTGERRLVFPAVALREARAAAQSLPRPRLHDEIEGLLTRLDRGVAALAADLQADAQAFRFPRLAQQEDGPGRAA